MGRTQRTTAVIMARQIKANPWAKPLFDMSSLPRYTVLYGGRAGGKDVATAQAMLSEMRRRPLRTVVVRQYMNSIAESMKALIEGVIGDMGLVDEFETKQGFIRCRATGAVIHFRGAHLQIQSVKGWDAYDLCVVNEAQSISHEAWEIIKPTIRKPGSRLILIMNPRYPRDPVAHEFLGEDLLGYERDDTLLINVNWQDNKYVSNEIRQEANRMLANDPLLYEHIYGGDYDRTALRGPFDAQAILDLERSHRPPDGGQHDLLAGVDIAVTESAGADYTVALWGTPDGVLIGYDRFKESDYKRQVSRLAGALTRCRRALVDTTGVGHTITRLLQESCQGHPGIVPIYWTGKEKTEMVGNLAGMLANRKLRLAAGADWDPLIDELRHYERHYTADDRPTPRYGAAVGYHDDLVSAMMLYAKAVREAQPMSAATAAGVYTVDGFQTADPEMPAKSNGLVVATSGGRRYDAQNTRGVRVNGRRDDRWRW